MDTHFQGNNSPLSALLKVHLHFRPTLAASSGEAACVASLQGLQRSIECNLPKPLFIFGSAVSLCVWGTVSLCSLSLGLVDFLECAVVHIFPNPVSVSANISSTTFVFNLHILSLNLCLTP